MVSFYLLTKNNKTTIRNSNSSSLALLLPTLPPRLLLLAIRLGLRSGLLLLGRRGSLGALGLLDRLYLGDSDCRLGLPSLLALAVFLADLDLRDYNLVLGWRGLGLGFFAGNLLAPALLLLGLLLLRRLGGIGLGVASLAACISRLAALDISLVLLVVEAAEVIGGFLLLLSLDRCLVDVLVVLDGNGGRLAV